MHFIFVHSCNKQQTNCVVKFSLNSTKQIVNTIFFTFHRDEQNCNLILSDSGKTWEWDKQILVPTSFWQEAKSINWVFARGESAGTHGTINGCVNRSTEFEAHQAFKLQLRYCLTFSHLQFHCRTSWHWHWRFPFCHSTKKNSQFVNKDFYFLRQTKSVSSGLSWIIWDVSLQR